jgi:hypothetical protein
MDTKICSSCKKRKNKKQFRKNTSRKDGLRSECKICSTKLDNNWYIKNKEKKKRQIRKHYFDNHQYYLKYARVYYNKNKKHLIKIDTKRKKERRKTDLNYKIICNLRGRISQALKSQKTHKDNSTLELLGCSKQELVEHLESQFQDGMSWENYGLYGWHIDHIIPVSSFDLSEPNQFKKCFHFSNLQPLWAIDNLRKSNKL